MQPRVIQRILGLLLMVFSFTMLPPAGVGWFYGDIGVRPFINGFLVTLGTGLLLWWPARHNRRELKLRDGFLVAVSFWVVLGLFGAIPLALAVHPHLSITDAVFESVSGLTTTGATVIVGLDRLPKSILFYRQELEWLGGMGIIVLAVAVLPMLGVGGMQLYRAETPGPIKDAKLTPRIAETAKALWYIYLGLTVACAVAYWLSGMDPFDAISYSFATVSIGGFAPHDASMGYFDSPLIESVAIVFMLLAGANFGLHFYAIRRRSLRPYLEDSEFRTYATVLALLAVIVVGYLYLNRYFGSFGEDFRQGLFQAVSIGTTTGFTTTSYHHWPGFLPALLIFASFIGGCAGSTGGGIKVVRFLLLIKQGLRELHRLIHPNAEFAVKIGRRPVDDRILDAVWGFFAAYVATFSLIMLALMATGLNQITAFSAVAACMNNLGPGLGAVGDNYAHINPVAKWLLCFAMLFGRLEVFTPLVLFTPGFWRR
ncbi:TrkH family potassium uptake protein [Acidihalobacter ferrooxydans]|uniref:Trk system potassium uptake protein n=1 Tax=Acidihalobacter ferrooxydans TaxID=1765967 RepID=A0A1P8UKL2_9GAMM|nr:TrkH family potassium uptake protein [Acidihalobacter ferrooxydans]APZ44370.1 potassium transporter [Acidihalobacter ferrooxydans]